MIGLTQYYNYQWDEAAKKAGLALTATQTAVIGYYLLIDFGFTTSTFQPNSIQFYSNMTGFLCSKLIDNASLVSLVPILNCKTVTVTWNTTTKVNPAASSAWNSSGARAAMRRPRSASTR